MSQYNVIFLTCIFMYIKITVTVGCVKERHGSYCRAATFGDCRGDAGRTTMLIATTVMILGLLAGIVVAQLRGLRLGGVVVVPLSAVYLLWDFSSAPVFLFSVLAAYVSLWIIKRRLLLFGRQLFIIAVIIGTLVPVIVFTLTSGFQPTASITTTEFVLTILPGVTAYNLHRLSAEKRVADVLWSLTTLLFLTVVGIGLVIAVGLTPLADFLPPVLLGPESQIANAFGLAVSRETVPVLASRTEFVALLTAGLVCSELIRSRYGLRVGGVIVVPVVALMAFRNLWMLPLWGVAALVAYAGIQSLHWWTLVYGRVLLSMGIILGLLVSISVVPQVPIRHGLLPFFVGIFGGVTGYNLHVVPRTDRPANVLVTISVLVGTIAVARLLLTPAPTGLLRTVTALDLVVGVLTALPGVYVISRYERLRPRGRRALRTDSAHREETEVVSD